MSIPDTGYLGEPGHPAPWATATPREGLRDTDQARVVSLAPDVCRSPTVPVPYPVVDFCGHDQNYTPSVRFTGQKTMVLRSQTSHVHGDEPGIGKGVVSGTVAGISEPITHASHVRAEGSPVIRHLDRFHMNNRNTVGEAVFVRDMRTYAAPKDDDPLPGSIRLADGSGNWGQSAQTAGGGAVAGAQPGLAQQRPQLAQAAPRPAPAPPPRPTPPAPRPPGTVIRPDVPQWRRPPPVSLPSPTIGARLGTLGRFGGRFLGFAGALLWPSPLGDGTLQNWYQDLQSPDPFRRRTAQEAQRLFLDDPRLRPQLEEWYRDETRDRPQPPPATRPDNRPDAAPVADNVRVDREDPEIPCLVGPYSTIVRACPGEAHHIVPDMAYRLGARPATAAGMASTANRIPNSPTLNEGMAICLTPAQHGRSADGLHGQLRAAFASMRSPVPGTAPMSDILMASVASVDGIPDLDPDCKRRAKVAVTGQVVSKTGLTAPGRTRESPLPSGAATVVLQRGYY